MSQDGAQGRYAGGSIAGGRYQLRDLLGEGGMASVYLAYDAALDRQVAIKTLHTELGREASFRERFRREAQAVAKLQHTNIVSVFDTGEDELGGATMPYIVMEYVEGQPLGSVLHTDIQHYGAMPADKALKMTADVLAALEVSHEMGLVHRDIKPGNVMVTKRGVVKVMDFGIARAMQSGVTSMTQTGMVVGTPQYLSPEQALGRGVDARSDLYSVGIMLFQLLTGRIPFDADSPLAIAYAHVQEEPVAPSSINRSIPPAVDALVARALKKNPNERFPSAAAMRDEIARISASGQTGAAPVITGGAPVSSGQGVGSAVFPPLDSSAQPGYQGSVQTPYQPSPYGPPTPAPTPQPSYGYPQQQMQQPAPMAQQTPPPYTISPTGPAGGGSSSSKKNTPVIVGAIAVAVLAVGGLVAALMMNSGGDSGKGGDSKASGSAVAGHKDPERSRTLDTTKCTSPQKSALDPSKVQAPDFTYKDILSVKSCIQAAGWKLNTTAVDNGQWGQDVVVTQFPAAGVDVDPKEAQFSLTLSTGNPPQQ
ncbi:protein kinase domain-containing protein [Streptomyces sp. CBMA152]|uniref:protein kinase domain-containing protein n=1 Tax=Streptomyces sp. CBMA152 TaxID=1896312 RepID=UPI0016608C2E|nr:protein kinase [Streptomyces sp. CBMA152]MBD0745953.1 serine/threonine protein kinase [Streptomyces sp. CBMA152]